MRQVYLAVAQHLLSEPFSIFFSGVIFLYDYWFGGRMFVRESETRNRPYISQGARSMYSIAWMDRGRGAILEAVWIEMKDAWGLIGS
jgi:hypothetical protein